jgi:hypothetical protein
VRLGVAFLVDGCQGRNDVLFFDVSGDPGGHGYVRE